MYMRQIEGVLVCVFQFGKIVVDVDGIECCVVLCCIEIQVFLFGCGVVGQSQFDLCVSCIEMYVVNGVVQVVGCCGQVVEDCCGIVQIYVGEEGFGKFCSVIVQF